MNSAARIKGLSSKWRFGIYLMAALSISSKKHSKYAGVSFDWTISIIKLVSLELVSE